jgi:hypothetical protein
LLSGRPVIARITRATWGPNLQIISGEDYLIQFVEECEWRSTGTIDHQQYGLVHDYTSRFAPGLMPFYGEHEMRGDSGPAGVCVNSPKDHKVMILNILFSFDSNGVLFYDRQPVGHLLRAP